MVGPCYRACVAIVAFIRPGWRTALGAFALACGSGVPLHAQDGDPALRLRPQAAEQQASTQGDPWLSHWWTAFDDPLLTRLVETGVAADPELALPTEQAARGGSGRKLGGRKRSGRADEAERHAALYERAQKQAEKAERIARAYFKVRATQQHMVVARESLESQQENIKVASLRFRAGLAPAYDANFARTQSATTAAALGEVEAEFQRDIARLAELTRIDAQPLREAFGTHVPTLTAPPLPPEDQGGIVALRRADLLALEQRLSARLIRDGVAQPAIDAAMAGQAAPPSDDLAEALASYEDRLSGARADVAVALETANAAQKRVATLERAVESARVALGDTRMAYNSGLDRFVSVYVAENALFEVRQAIVAAQRTHMEALIRYFTALGGGWRIEQPRSGTPVPARNETGARDE